MANDSKKLDDLIDALGQIDDRFIHEAGNVTPFTFAGFRRKKRLLPVLLAAALPCVLLLGVFTILNAPGAGFDGIPGQTDGTAAHVSNGSTSRPEPNDRSNPLEISLLSLTGEQLAGHRIDGEGLFLDGDCRLVWTYGDGSYYAVSVTDRDDLRRLRDYLTDPDSIVPADEASGAAPDATVDSGLRFWICTGDGVSATPYLLYGAWGVGNLFDYNPESIPSSDFASFLTDLIQKYLA